MYKADIEIVSLKNNASVTGLSYDLIICKE